MNACGDVDGLPNHNKVRPGCQPGIHRSSAGLDSAPTRGKSIFPQGRVVACNFCIISSSERSRTPLPSINSEASLLAAWISTTRAPVEQSRGASECCAELIATASNAERRQTQTFRRPSTQQQQQQQLHIHVGPQSAGLEVIGLPNPKPSSLYQT